MLISTTPGALIRRTMSHRAASCFWGIVGAGGYNEARVFDRYFGRK